MRALPYSDLKAWVRRRGVPLALALIIEALLLYALFTAVFDNGSRRVAEKITNFSLEPSTNPTPSRAAAKQAKAQPKADARPRTAPPPPIKLPPTKPSYVELSRADFAASDISKLAKPGEGAGSSSGTQTAMGPGEGPGGAPLYNAEWYREPTPGEMALYLPENRPPGSWGMIVCRTIERYHVDDCRTLGEDPPGSGLARALRQAAWQFLVRPPRVGDKPQIGAWVRIRFTFTREGDGRFSGAR